MNIEKLLNSKVGLAAVGFVGLFAVSKMLGKSLGETAHAAVESVNPLNKNNVVYRGLNAVGDVVDDGEDDNSWSLGAWVYNVTHADEVDEINQEQAILNQEFQRRYGDQSPLN